MLRQQPPAYSPVTARAIWGALWHDLRRRTDGPANLAGLLARRYDAEHVRLFGSGTEALRAALRLAMRTVGESHVALPAFACYAIAAAAVAVRARIHLYDVEPASLAPRLASLARALDQGARVVVVAPLYGLPVDWDAVQAFVDRYGGVAIEDAAQGHGAEWRGRPLGSLGRISVVSFGRGKGWTGGAGGALLLRAGQSPDGAWHAERRTGLRDELRVLGTLAAQWALARPGAYALPLALPWLHLGETVYRDARPPGPITRTACSSAEALEAAADSEARARRANAAALIAAIGPAPAVQTVPAHPDATPGFLRLPVRLPRGLAGFRDPRLAARLGVTLAYPSPLSGLAPVQSLLEDRESPVPGANELARTLFTLPTHSRLRVSERDRLAHLLREYAA